MSDARIFVGLVMTIGTRPYKKRLFAVDDCGMFR